MKPLILAPIAACALLAGCAGTPREPANLPPAPASGSGLTGGQCFRQHDIKAHTVVDAKTLLLRAGRNDVYRVTMRGACLAAAVSSDPIITEQHGGSDLVCKPLDLDLSIAKGGFATPCLIDSIARMSDAEVAALPKRLRP